MTEANNSSNKIIIENTLPDKQFKYTFEKIKNGNGNNSSKAIVFFEAKENNERLKTDYFQSEIILPKTSPASPTSPITMCKRKGPATPQKECNTAKTGVVTSTSDSLISRKLNRNANPLSTYFLLKKVEEVLTRNGINLTKMANSYKKNNATPAPPASGGSAGQTFLNLYLIAHIASGILCLTGVGCIAIIFFLIVDFIILIILGGFANRSLIGGNKKGKSKKGGGVMNKAVMAKDLVKVLIEAKNLCFFEIGNIINNPDQESADTVKAYKDIYGENPPKTKVESLDKNYKYFLACEFPKSLPKTYMKIPYICRIKNDTYNKMIKDIRNYSAKIALIASSSNSAIIQKSGKKAEEFMKLEPTPETDEQTFALTSVVVNTQKERI